MKVATPLGEMIDGQLAGSGTVDVVGQRREFRYGCGGRSRQ